VRGEPIEQSQAFECLKQLNINARLSLKIGCRVMLISNASSYVCLFFSFSVLGYHRSLLSVLLLVSA
jgi:hypothetical protein